MTVASESEVPVAASACVPPQLCLLSPSPSTRLLAFPPEPRPGAAAGSRTPRPLCGPLPWPPSALRSQLSVAPPGPPRLHGLLPGAACHRVTCLCLPSGGTAACVRAWHVATSRATDYQRVSGHQGKPGDCHTLSWAERDTAARLVQERVSHGSLKEASRLSGSRLNGVLLCGRAQLNRFLYVLI